MKNYTILLFSLICASLFSQSNYDKEWQEVYQHELDGKTRSAFEVVENIYKKAKRKKDKIQIIKTFFYTSKFTQALEEDAQSKIIVNLNNEIREADETTKAILNCIYASILENYYKQNSYTKIRNRTKIENENETNFLLWTSTKFESEIEKAYENTLQNRIILQQQNIIQFKDIFTISPDINAKNYTLYDYLWNELFTYRKNNKNNWEISRTNKNNTFIEKLYANPSTFISTSTDIIYNINFKKTITLLQQYEAYYSKKDTDKLDKAYSNRLNYIHSIFKNNTLYIKELKSLEETTKNKHLQQQLKVDKAKYFNSITNKNSEKNYYNEVLVICDSVLNSRVNNNALAEAEILKNNILRKVLNIQIKNTLYENENTRAHITYKNIDTLTIHYFKIPKNFNAFKNTKKPDSIFRDFVDKNKAVKTYTRILSNKKDYFTYTTEILLEQIPLGDYILVFQPNSQKLVKDNYEYQTITVSNIAYIKDSDDKYDYFYVSDRKTGKPLQNIIVRNNEETKLTDALGKVDFKKKKYVKKTSKNPNSDIYFIHKKDTLVSNYNKGWFYKKDKEDFKYEDFEAKAKVYFDRAIYRPGQKVYYKGIIIQNINGEKSIVPHLTVSVLIEDANSNTLKEYEVQTNDFGSFAGEFDLPKNILTGQFSVTIDEPDNYDNDKKYYDEKEDEHQFWDNVDFDYDNEFNFQVEEYKRPTFEVSFESIKENYTLSDTLKIVGNTKTLAGSNLTNATVNYTISKRIYTNKYIENLEREDITNTIETDSKGNFTISITANDSLVENKDIREINYTIEAEVIDLNGETRTASKYVKVENRTLKLSISTNPTLYKEEENHLTITATTLNDYPIDAKGKIEIYYIEKKQFLKPRLFSIPEIQSIVEKDFRKLFPNEPFDVNDTKINEILIKTISFDTKNKKTVLLDSLKKLKKGNYKLIAKAFDSKNNQIEGTHSFELKSRKEIFNESVLFTFKDVTEAKSDYFEFEFQSVIPDLNIFSRFYIGKELDKEFVVQLTNGIGKLKIKKQASSKENLFFHFSTRYDNETFNKTYSVSKEEIAKKLEFEIISLRNKIEPGSKENWSFKILNQKLETEVLASMYDSSLDQFTQKEWDTKLNFNENYSSPDYPRFYEDKSKYVYFNKFDQSIKYYQYYIKNPQLNWFGFNFNGSYSKYAQEKYLETIESLTEIPKDAKIITGTILDKFGPLAGANITVQGTKRGTTSDFDGNFSIQAEANEILTISYIGTIDTYYTVKGKNNTIYITLQEDTNALQEVVVVGYGMETKRNLTGNVSKIKDTVADDTLLFSILNGAVDGVYVSSGSGQVGNASSVRIRGTSSVNKEINPLYIVDGIPVDSSYFAKLKVENIESVSVLKDASAVALYGSRASNGVIIITTKQALKEITQVKTRTNFNETAFFFPQLQTDKEGKIILSFTSPESLTRWKLRLLGHNKNFETGYFQNEIISQKNIMVMPNLPRFVREKDTLTITTKVVNMTNETKAGLAMLLLFDATNGKAIDSISLNLNNRKDFICKPKESISVSWTITIPENLQGLQYKIVAKSGTFSDGEENILPVLSNKILVTESIPLWVRENSKKEYVFENLKNNTSTTLQNHNFTLEYTTNPIWFAIQSLPYLMEFEHECAEQTFARYYANTIASEIVTKNPKIASLFESYRNKKSPKSKLIINEELKSILLAETPWFFDSEDKTEKNKQLAYLFDLATLKNKEEQTLEKLEAKLLPSGGFPWFDGGNENPFITQHILAGIGHLNVLFPNDKAKYKKIVTKGIPFLDQKFISQYEDNKTIFRNYSYNNIHYLYMRSFFVKEYPIATKLDSLLQMQLKEVKKNWLNYSLYQKGQLALILNRFGEVEMAKKMITHLKETASLNEDLGMYWIENTKSWYWYQSPIETQAVLIEAFNEVIQDTKSVDLMKVWLLKNKQNKNWSTTKATTEAIYAILLHGNDWTSVKDKTKFKIGNEKILSDKLATNEKEVETGYIKINWKTDEISQEMATISIENKSDVPSYGGVYWQYFENLENIKESTNSILNIKKELYKKEKTGNGTILKEIQKENLKIGDIITIRLILKAIEDIEFAHLKDLRASCFEPLDVISKHERKDNLYYYKSTKDIATHFFFDKINKGTYILEYDVRANNSGSFNDGISTLQSMYAPEFSANSKNSTIKVTK
ncbi:TonB-dependent receptor plug domain-containing protein [Flavobacterium jejuense]|uniref:TonB-dependent receptor plug domain-containing protein n=1 Tax=Flavobacterium jejuense TaxID=1544455 RepID=A0ABX0IQA9_9FLAO|nr:MG2 domain-containing protein [Flavobacterium jejuense]NHN26032.1 TonB-dependent receptor plug domain-containing protein [Flavobacterium jejuense]